MRIFITTMDDPLVTNDFIEKIIEVKKEEIIGIAVSENNRFTSVDKKIELRYAITLFIIVGLVETFRKMLVVLKFKIRERLSRIFKSIKSPSILAYAERQGIATWKVKSVNNTQFLDILNGCRPDVIINQAQEILKKDFLNIPRIAVLNRHNSLLPKYRGRLAPFWALYNGEKETGVTIHLVIEKIDAGPIVCQKRIPIKKKESFKSLVEKCYSFAPVLMCQALNMLGDTSPLILNDNEKATYFSIPTLKQAILFRIRNVLKTVSRGKKYENPF